MRDFNMPDVVEFNDELLKKNQGATSMGKCTECNRHSHLYNGLCEPCEDDNFGDDAANERVFMSHVAMSRGLSEDERLIYNL